ncbi:MAG TPA: DUF4386 domain-containing protein [Caulobacteraceae bacterium]|nr:DUF4386 domain-containing protein [Caulobacteraceae bacterium]
MSPSTLTARTLGASARLKARVAGALYLATTAGGFVNLSIENSMIVRGDAAATTSRILAAEPLFRLGILAELVAGACYIGVTVLLYELLKPVNRTISLLAAFLSLAGCAVGAGSAVLLLAPFLLQGDGSQYMAAFTPQQLQGLAMTAVRLEGQGYNISMMFFGLYCALVGGLVFRSGFMPRLVGVLMMCAGLGWLTNTFAALIDPPFARSLQPYIMAPGGVGEISLMLWLLFVGVNGPQWETRAEAAMA